MTGHVGDTHGGDMRVNVIDQEAAGVPGGVQPDADAAGRVPLVRSARYKGVHRPPSRRGRSVVGGVAAVLLLAAGAVLATSAPVQAATPRCNNYARFTSLSDPIEEDIYMPAANDGWGPWKCLMSYGDNNKGVAEMQRALNLCYGTTRGVNLGISLTVDGSFGPRTKSALVKVQQYLRITADGIYGPQTAAASLHRAYSKTPYGWYWTCIKPSVVGLT